MKKMTKYKKQMQRTFEERVIAASANNSLFKEQALKKLEKAFPSTRKHRSVKARILYARGIVTYNSSIKLFNTLRKILEESGSGVLPPAGIVCFVDYIF